MLACSILNDALCDSVILKSATPPPPPNEIMLNSFMWEFTSPGSSLHTIRYLFSLAVTISTHLCEVCRHFCCPLLLFQSQVACQNFALTRPRYCQYSFAFSFAQYPNFILLSRTFQGRCFEKASRGAEVPSRLLQLLCWIVMGNMGQEVRNCKSNSFLMFY